MSDKNLLSILLEDSPSPDEWSARQVLELTSNPAYAGIGPFSGNYEGEEFFIPAIPAIVADKLWIEVQVGNVKEFGVRNVLRLTRKVLHEALGIKLAVLAHHTWLDNSAAEIEAIGAKKYFENLLSQLRSMSSSTQLAVDTVKVQDVTPQIIEELIRNPSEILRLPPDKFEDLVHERLHKMGFLVERVGRGTYAKDGGIDIVAVPENAPFPFLLAVQVKHHRTAQRKTGSSDVRDLLGVLNRPTFHAGLLVTNTTFTPDAQWLAEQRKDLLRLRDFEDVQRWLLNGFLHEYDWRELPTKIEVCPGVHVNLDRIG